MSWFQKVLTFLNNRIAEPIHAHIRKVLDVPSNAELLVTERYMANTQSNFLHTVETVEAMLEGREQALHRTMTRIESKLHDMQELDKRVLSLHSEAERVAGSVTVAASDAVVALAQIQDLLREVKAYEQKKVKDYEAR